MENPTTEANKGKKHDKPRQKKPDQEKTETDPKSENPKQPKHEKAPRNDEWKVELEKTITLETKIPPMPKEEALLKKPDPNLHKNNLERIAKKIAKNYDEIEELKKQEKELRDGIFTKNNVDFIELKKLQDEKRDLNGKMDANKKEKDQIKAQIENFQNKKSQLEKKGVNGKALPREKLEEVIREKEKEYKNSLKTATDEKRYLEEIEKLKACMPLMNDISKVQDQIQLLHNQRKTISTANNALKEKIDAVRAKADEIRIKLNLMDRKEEGDQDKKEQDKKEKPKRELTQEEKDLQAKRQALFDKITSLKEERQNQNDKFGAENDAYYKQQHEVYKIKFMSGIQKKLKHIENQRKWEAEQARRKQEDLDKAKAMVSFKFNDEIEMCDYLSGMMEQIKMKDKMESELGGNLAVKPEFKVDDKLLKSENLVFMKPKKAESEGVQPGHKKNQKKKQADPKPVEENKFAIDIATIQNFNKVDVQPPTSLAQVDKALADLSAKKAAYMKLKDDAIAEAQSQVGQPKEEKEQKKDEPKTEEQPEPEKPAKQENAKKKTELVFDETSFPALN